MDPVKEAFHKIKEDIFLLKQEMQDLQKGLKETRNYFIEMCGVLEQINKKISKKQEIEDSTHQQEKPTNQTFSSTQNKVFKPLNTQNNLISIGNEGVPTDRQTDRQTNRQTDILENPIENAAEILDSLDGLKKEIRLKFKRLTDQEILVFSTLYQLDEEKGHTNYKTLSEKLNLTESSIRDYIGRLIKKGIPVEKNKINNKSIHLKISEKLKKIASLSTILQLRSI